MALARIAWLTQPGAISFEDLTLPVPGIGEVQCETVVSAISPGTELSAYRGLPHLRPGVCYPRLLGYCNVARIIAKDEGVLGLEVGDRVLTHQSHRSHFNVAADDVLLKLAPGADAGGIACAYLFHLGYDATLRSDVRVGSRVLVIGLGALGLTSVALAALAGARVVAVTEHAASADKARQMGAEEVLTRAQVDMGAIPWAEGADVVIVTTNAWADWTLALQQAGRHATIGCVGFPGRGEPAAEVNPLASEYFYVKQLRIVALGHSPQRRDARGYLRFNERDNLAFVAHSIMTGQLRPNVLISGRYAAADIADAYENLISRHDGAITYLLDWAA